MVQLVGEALHAGDARLILVLTGWNANDGDFAAHRAAQHRSVPWTSVVDDWLERSRLYKTAKQALTVRGRTLTADGVEIVPQTTAMSLYDFTAYQEIAQKNLRTARWTLNVGTLIILAVVAYSVRLAFGYIHG